MKGSSWTETKRNETPLSMPVRNDKPVQIQGFPCSVHILFALPTTDYHKIQLRTIPHGSHIT